MEILCHNNFGSHLLQRLLNTASSCPFYEWNLSKILACISYVSPNTSRTVSEQTASPATADKCWNPLYRSEVISIRG